MHGVQRQLRPIALFVLILLAAAGCYAQTSDSEHLPGVRVIAASKGGSPDVEASRSRVDKFTAELRDKWNIEIVSDIRLSAG